MTILSSQTIKPEFIKLRWEEPYVSSALNKKTFKTIPRGVYRGFEVTAGPGAKDVTVNVMPTGSVSGYQGGNADAASGWSIAVHENLDGFTTTIAMQQGPDSVFVFDLTPYAGTNVYVVLDAQYGINISGAQVKIVDGAALDADPQLIVLARVNIPLMGPILNPNIVYDDVSYPRIKPYATSQKDGFMSPIQAELLERLNPPNASNAFEEEQIISVDGPQIVNIPNGETYVIGGLDLLVFKNGVKMFKGRDYIEVDRGDGFGEQVNFLSSLRADDRITFRGQKYAVSLTNTLTVFDEDVAVQTNVTRLNFVGASVVAVPDGSGTAKVIISGGGGAGVIRNKMNGDVSIIPAFKAVHLQSDGTVIPCNPTVSGHIFYGLTMGTMTVSGFGDVATNGVANSSVSGLGFSVGEDIFVSHVGDGSLTNSAPDPLNGSVFRVGIADCLDTIASPVAIDLIFDKARLA